MNDGLIPRRYALALYKSAVAESQDKALYALMSHIGKAFDAEPRLEAVMANPFVSEADKKALLIGAADAPRDAAEGSPAKAATAQAKNAPKNTPAKSPAATKTDPATSLLGRFIDLLAANKRLPFIRRTALAYEDIYRERHGIHRVAVTSAAPLSQQSLDRITDAIKRRLGPGETMEIKTAVDPALIGGFTVTIDNNKLDASVANELKQMRLNLLSK